jgi:copper chaperone CopZ
MKRIPLIAMVPVFALVLAGCDQRPVDGPGDGSPEDPVAMLTAAKAHVEVSPQDTAAEPPAAEPVEGVSHAFNVEGMSCEGCVIGLTIALERIKGVRDVQVSLADKRAVVVTEPQGPAPDQLASAISERGLRVVQPME